MIQFFSNIDFFNFWRFGLSWVVTVYATIITVQGLWGWYVWLAGTDKYTSMLRRYILVHSLRFRLLKLGPDVLICVLLTVAFFILWHAHHVLEHTKDRIRAANHVPAAIQPR